MDIMSNEIAEFMGAFLKAQKEIDSPSFNAKVSYGRTEFEYADLKAVAEAVKKPLNENGIAINQLLANDGDKVGVITQLTHADSGQWMRAAVFVDPDKQEIQGKGSIWTYLKRYSLSSMVLCVADDDKDGKGNGKGGKEKENLGSSITEEQLTTIKKGLKETKADNEKFCAYYGIKELKDLPKNQFNDAMNGIATKKAGLKRKESNAGN